MFHKVYILAIEQLLFKNERRRRKKKEKNNNNIKRNETCRGCKLNWYYAMTGTRTNK